MVLTYGLVEWLKKKQVQVLDNTKNHRSKALKQKQKLIQQSHQAPGCEREGEPRFHFKVVCFFSFKSFKYKQQYLQSQVPGDQPASSLTLRSLYRSLLSLQLHHLLWVTHSCHLNNANCLWQQTWKEELTCCGGRSIHWVCICKAQGVSPWGTRQRGGDVLYFWGKKLVCLGFFFFFLTIMVKKKNTVFHGCRLTGTRKLARS